MERVVFYRERGALPYDAFAYGTAIALVDMPYLFAQVTRVYHTCTAVALRFMPALCHGSVTCRCRPC